MASKFTRLSASRLPRQMSNSRSTPFFTRSFGASQSHHYSHSSHSSRSKSGILSKRFLQGIAFGLTGGLTFASFGQLQRYFQPDAAVSADSSPAFPTDDVVLQPPTDVPPFPSQISINKVPFLALGTGVRSVTFLSFHVYAAGLYIAADDVPLARKISLNAVHKHEVKSTVEFARILNSIDDGTDIVNELSKENVRFAVRIVPTRNTDFSHLRDGFVRSITNHPEAKTLQSPEFGQSIGEIKKAFGRKRKLHKGEVVTWSRDVTGGMTAWYGKSDDDKELLGSLPDADVARSFFLQYMTGAKPNSPSLKANALNGLAIVAA